MNLRRRQILLDEAGPNVVAKLGEYLPTNTPTVRTVANVIPPTPIGTTLSNIVRDTTNQIINTPLSIQKNLPMSTLSPASIPVDPRISAQLARISATSLPISAAPIDRMKAIPTELVPKFSFARDQAGLLPNTIAERIKSFLSNKLPNIDVSTITNLLSKVKTPLLATLGIAALAGIVYAGYSIYRRFNRPTIAITDTNPPLPTSAGLPRYMPSDVGTTVATPLTVPETQELAAMPAAPSQQTFPAESSIHTVYPEDIAAIIADWRDRFNLSLAERVSLVTQIRAIAETTDDAAEFVKKVAELESKLSRRAT
jgi:hypothetical protein